MPSFSRETFLDLDILCEFSKDVDIVIHLAAITDVNESVINPDITKKNNVDGTINVLQCCVKNKIKKIIFTSSAAVYGDFKRDFDKRKLYNKSTVTIRTKQARCRKNNCKDL